MKKIIILFIIISMTIFSQSRKNSFYYLLGDPDVNYQLLMPDTIYTPVGYSYKVFWESLGLNISRNQTVQVTPALGTVTDTCLSYTPYQPDTFAVGYKYSGQREVTSKLNIADTSKIVAATTLLYIGDSRNGVVTTIKTLGGSNLTLLGTQGTTPNFHEAYGGKTYAWFESNVSSPFVYSGNINFAQYLSAHSYSAPDYVIIRLGTNDVFMCNESNRVSTVSGILLNVDSLINSIHSAGANTKIGICLETPPAKESMFYATYTTTQTRSQYHKNIHYFNQQLYAKYGKGGTRELSYVTLIPLYIYSDPSNDFSNGVHETSAGYTKEANYMYAWLRSRIRFTTELITASINRTLEPVSVYNSDFTAGVDGWTNIWGTITGNVDGIYGVNDVARTVANGSGAYSNKDLAGVLANTRYTITTDYFAPNAASLTAFNMSIGGDVSASYFPLVKGSWQLNKKITFGNSPTGAKIRTLFSGSANGDSLYIKNMKVSQVSEFTTTGNHSFDTTSTYKVTGSYSGKIVSTAAGNGSTNTISFASTKFTATTNGKYYRFSCYAYTTTASTTMTFKLGDIVINKTVPTAGFHKIVYDFKATGSTTGNIYLYLNKAATVYIDEVSLKSGQ